MDAERVKTLTYRRIEALGVDVLQQRGKIINK